MTNAGRSRTTTLVLLAVVVLFTLLGIWFSQREDRAREEALAPTPVARESAAATELAETDLDSAVRVEAVKPAPSTDSSVEAAAASTKAVDAGVEGRVLDLEGKPIEGAVIARESKETTELARSASDGSFHFTSADKELRLIALHPSWRTIRSQVWRADLHKPGFIVAAPCVPLSGEVVNEDGADISRVNVWVHGPETLLARFPFDPDAYSWTQRSTQVTVSAGKFQLDKAICAPGTMLEADCEGFVRSKIPITCQPNAFVRVVLVKDANVSKRTIRGIVVRQNGEPATRATVRFDKDRTDTDAQGAFTLSCTKKHDQPFWDWQDDTLLIATEVGSQAALVQAFGRVMKESDGDPPPQKLILGPRPLSISGRVLDARRTPLAGYTITLLNPTRDFTAFLMPPEALEQFAAEGSAVTDEQGAFEIGGLFDRRYRLQAFHKKTFGRLESAEIQAGTRDVELVFRADAFVPVIEGRVVGLDGSAIEGAQIMLMVLSSKHLNAAGEDAGSSTSGRRAGTTDAGGSFRLENVPRETAVLRVTGAGFLESAVKLADVDLEHPIVIHVERSLKFTIEGLPKPIDKGWPHEKGKLQLLALDARQNELRVRRSANSNYDEINRLELGDDPAEIYSVSEAAVEFVLYADDGTILGRRPVRLVAGSVSVVTW